MDLDLDLPPPEPTPLEKLARIQAHLRSGGVVQTVTYTRATQYTLKHLEWFTATERSLYVRSGTGKVCLNFTTIRFWRSAAKEAYPWPQSRSISLPL